MAGSQQYQDISYVQTEPWMDHSGYNPQHHSPMEEYPQYGFASSPPIQPGFATPMHHRPALQPIVTGTWPSQIASQQQLHQQQQQHQQQHGVYSAPSSAVQSLPPPSHTTPMQPLHPSPQSAQTPSLASSQPPLTSTTTPRRTLTDTDRRKMCQYHEEHPTKKQTEIGEIFGVERSTVSKVLRQKEKYLRQDEGSRSPVKPSKKNKPDLDRALAKWATNQQSRGVRVTDDNIRTQARFFWSAAGNTGEPPIKLDNTAWIDKFRQKNNLSTSGSKGRRSPIVGDDPTFSPISPDAAPSSAVSDQPISPEEALSRNVSPTSATDHPQVLRRQPSQSYDGLGIRNAAGLRTPLHTQSNTSLSSAFTEATAASQAFSSENTSVGSPVISPDVISTSSSYFPPPPITTPTAPQQRTSDPNNPPRPRSQTFPTTTSSDAYISPPQSANTTSPASHSTVAVFDSPSGEMLPPPAPGMKPHGSSPLSPHHSSAQSPNLTLNKTKSTPHLGTTNRHATAVGPSTGEALAGLKTAVAYLRAQGFGKESADVAAIHSVMMKLSMNQTAEARSMGGAGGSGGGGMVGAMGTLPGGLHRIPEAPFGRGEEGEDMLMGGMEAEEGRAGL